MSNSFLPREFYTSSIDLVSGNAFSHDKRPIFRFENNMRSEGRRQKWDFYLQETDDKVTIFLQTYNDDNKIKIRKWRYENCGNTPLKVQKNDEFVLRFGENPIEIFD